MSGGSYNYLYSKDLDENEDDIERLVERLRMLGHDDAAARAAHAAASLRRADEIRREMQDVWQAVEWNESGDWGEESVAKAVKRWGEATR